MINENEGVKIETICKFCIFATREENGNQLGCQFDNLRKFEEDGTEIAWVKDDGPDYAKIINRWCVHARTENWEHADEHDAKERLRDYIRNMSRIDVIIDFDHEHTLFQLQTTIDSLKAQTLKPNRVVVTTNMLRPKLMVSIVNFMKHHMADVGIPWNVSRPVKEEEKQMRVARGFQKSTKMYYAFFDAGYNVHPEFINDIEKLQNEELKYFSLILPIEEDNGTVIQAQVFNLLGHENNFVGKVQELAQEQNFNRMVKRPEEVYSWLKK